MSDRISRRQFAGAVATSSTLLAGVAGHAQEPATKPRSEKNGDQGNTEKAVEARSTLELTVQIAKQEFPHEKLDETALEEIRSDIRGHLARSKVLSAFPLTNADEPGFLFSAWRQDPV